MQLTADYTESNRCWPSVFYYIWQRLIWASVVAWVERLDYRNRATEFDLRMSCTTSKSSRSFYRIRMRPRSLMQSLSQFHRRRFRLVARDMCSSRRFDRTPIDMRRSCDRTWWGGLARSRSIWTLFLCLMMLMRMRISMLESLSVLDWFRIDEAVCWFVTSGGVRFHCLRLSLLITGIWALLIS